MWTSRIIRCVGLLLDPLIPVVSVAVQSTNAMAINADIVTAKNEGRGLVLIANWKRCIEPILDVSAPLQSVREELVRNTTIANAPATRLEYRCRHLQDR